MWLRILRNANGWDTTDRTNVALVIFVAAIRFLDTFYPTTVPIKDVLKDVNFEQLNCKSAGVERNCNSPEVHRCSELMKHAPTFTFRISFA